jgi:hypothetical protein
MLYAQFIVSQPEGMRLRLIELPRAHVMEIAGADREVIEQLLSAEGEDSIDVLSVRGLRERIRELEAGTTDLQVQLETAEAEAEGLKKRIKRGLPDREDDLPHAVADLRAEVMALGKKAQLAIESFNPLGIDLLLMRNGHGAAQGWAEPTIRLAISQLSALSLQIDGMLQKFLRELPEGDEGLPVVRSRLTKQEVLESAQRFAELSQLHTYEAALREWQREQERPAGKGRPKAKPVAPAGAAS